MSSTTRNKPGVRKRNYTRTDGTVTTRYTARLAYRNGHGDRVYDESRAFATHREAAAEYIRMKAAREAGTYTSPHSMSVTEYFEEHWLKSIRARVKVTTYASYARDWNRHIKPEFGALRLQSLSPLQFDAFYRTLATERTVKTTRTDGTVVAQVRKPLSAKTIRNIHATIVKALGDAVDGDLLARNAASKAKPPRVTRDPESEIQAWDNHELRAFLTEYRKDRWYPEMRLAAMTGMRRGEVLGLRWKDIDFENETLSVRQALLSSEYKTYFDTTKSRKARSITLDEKTIKMLKRRRAAQNEERLAGGEGYMASGLVFTGENGSLVHPDSFSQAFERLVERTSLQRITLHGLRHTHATLLLKAGVPVNVVSQRLGHSDPGFTLRQYAHVLPSMQADAAKKITAMVDG